jgi:hypothetical protein
MAQTFTYSTMWAVPLPSQIGKTPHYEPRTMFGLKLTGPATSVQAGMTIASISNDLKYVDALWCQHFANDDYRFSYSTAASHAASTMLIKIMAASTGVLQAAATDLSAVVWYAVGIGTGKFSTLND